MFILLFLLLQVYTINGSVERIEVKELPFVLPLHKEFREGDIIKFGGVLDPYTGIQFDLMNTPLSPAHPPESWRDLLHIILNGPRRANKGVYVCFSGQLLCFSDDMSVSPKFSLTFSEKQTVSPNKLIIDSFAYKWMYTNRELYTSPPKFTVQISIGRKAFEIAINEKKISLPITQPFVLGTYLRLKEAYESNGKAKIAYLTIERKIDTPQVYIPRFQNAEQFSHFEENAENITKTCNEEGKKGRNVYLQYQVSENKCIPFQKPPSSGPYLELLPISYTQCPCECSNNPQQFAILRLFDKLKIDAEKEPQIVVFEAWPRYKRIGFFGNGPFTMQFFPKLDSNENCENSRRNSSVSVESKSKSATVIISCYEKGDNLMLSIVLEKGKEITHPAETIGAVKISGKGEFHFEKI